MQSERREAARGKRNAISQHSTIPSFQYSNAAPGGRDIPVFPYSILPRAKGGITWHLGILAPSGFWAKNEGGHVPTTCVTWHVARGGLGFWARNEGGRADEGIVEQWSGGMMGKYIGGIPQCSPMPCDRQTTDDPIRRGQGAAVAFLGQ
jgi:hypothetical protein